MTRMRRLHLSELSRIGCLHWIKRQLQAEGCAASNAVTVHTQGTTDLARCQRPAVQTKAVPGRAGRKAVVENPRKIPRRDTDAVVGDHDAYSPVGAAHTEGHPPVR